MESGLQVNRCEGTVQLSNSSSQRKRAELSSRLVLKETAKPQAVLQQMLKGRALVV